MRMGSRAASFFQLGIRQKVALVLVCVLTAALGASTWFTLRQHEAGIMEETRRHGEDLTRIVSQNLAYSVVGYDYHAIQLLLDEIARSHDIGYAQVVSEKGNTMAESGRPPDADTSWTVFTRDIRFDDKPVGRLTIGLDNREIIQRLHRQEAATLTREAATILFILLAEFLALSWLIVRPVSIISRALDQGVDASGQILQRIPLGSKDELGRLAAQFNELRERLNEANARLQSEIDLADAKLSENHRRLQQQAAELQRMNSELQHLALTDPLTGLYNRRYFDQVVESDLALSLRHDEPNSVLVVDVDRFKRINDTYGHETGDRVLVEIGAILSGCLRRSDLACRMGGEEFVLFCRRANREESLAVGEKIRHAVESHPFRDPAGESIPVTVSIGIATFPDGERILSVKDCFRHADLALYRSKADGRNRVTHFSQVFDNRGG